jgi:hypothetical protein
MAQEDGGPAFPSFQRDYHGMSIRDWFAGQALTGLMANPTPLIDTAGATVLRTPDVMASCSYKVADAMLAARSAS